MKLSIRILSGSCLPKPKPADNKCIDPYVRVSVFDVKGGYKEDVSTFSTGVIYNNGFFPIWNEVKFNFVVESWPSAMLQVTIFDKVVAPSADEFVATAAIPISCLRQGLRCVKLNDATNLRSGAMDFVSLLVEVTKTWGDATDLAKRDSFGGSAHNKPDILQLTRSRTDNSKGSNNKGTSKPTRLERARTENTVETVPASPRRGSSGPRLEKTKLVRARTDQSKGEASLSSLAEF